MKDPFIPPKPLLGLSPKILLDENKIKNIESRLMGPNNEGKAPSECQPLKESELENIKTKIILNNPLAPKEIKENINNSSNKKNVINTEIKTDEKFLQKKRILDDKKKEKVKLSQFEEKLLHDDLLNISTEKNNNSSNKSNFSEKSYNNSSSELSPKNNLTNNNLNMNSNTASNKNNKTILDYYPTKFISRSNNNSNIIKNNNNSVSTSKKNSGEKHHNNKEINNNNNIELELNEISQNLVNNHNSNNNSSEYNTMEQLMKKITEQNLIIETKDKEISSLKSALKENEEIIQSLQEYKKNSDIEIKRCRLDISNMVKEISELQREKKNKWINEQEYYLGKFGIQRFSHGQMMDYWEDGVKIIELKKNLENIKMQKEEIDKQKKRLSSNKNRRNNQNQNQTDDINNNNININNTENFDDSKGLLYFKMMQLQKEEAELKEQKNKLEIEKSILIHEINLYNQETRCSFSQKKEGWPLLGGRYQIVSLLGKGGYSEVYKAYDLENHMYVACKLHQLNQNWKEEVKDNYIKHTVRENQIHQEINHSKIVRHFDTIEIDNNSFCTVLEYCSGPDLATYLQRNRFIQEKEARIIITQILEGLEYLNKLPNKIIHYDLKPENIIFNNMEVKISDFGLAKIVENNTDRVQLTSQGVGTYWYLPPECFEEKKNIDISSKVDIWSVGVILFEMFFRKKPFGQNYTQDKLLKDRVMQNARVVDIPTKPNISEECKDFIRKCLAYHQEDRYDVFQALESPFIKQEKGKDSYKKLKSGINSNNGSSTNLVVPPLCL
jgi:tousled-like kinase